MIDLKKPLEGAPGLLLMASLIFFGAVLGIVAVLFFKWVRLEPDMANFLGGVVGAFLGSSMAVLGAIYVQKLERRAALAEIANPLQVKLMWLENRFDSIIEFDIWGPALDNYLGPMEEELLGLPDGGAISADTFKQLDMMKKFAPVQFRMLRSQVGHNHVARDNLVRPMLKEVRRALQLVRAAL